MAHLARDGLGEVALAGRVLDQQHLAGADDARLAVARLDADAAVEVDDVLPARRGMPFVVVAAGRLAEDDAGRLEGVRGLAAPALVLPFDLDVAEMRLALVVDIELWMRMNFLPPLAVSGPELRTKPCSKNLLRPLIFDMDGLLIDTEAFLPSEAGEVARSGRRGHGSVHSVEASIHFGPMQRFKDGFKNNLQSAKARRRSRSATRRNPLASEKANPDARRSLTARRAGFRPTRQ